MKLREVVFGATNDALIISATFVIVIIKYVVIGLVGGPPRRLEV